MRRNQEGVPLNCTILVMFLNCASRVAVPCFFMLSGAFLLGDERNADYHYFYKKTIKHIGITGVVFCLLYTAYNIVKLYAGVFVFQKYSTSDLLPGLSDIVRNLLTGQPYYHLWYLYTLAGLYIATPFVIRLADVFSWGGKFVW